MKLISMTDFVLDIQNWINDKNKQDDSLFANRCVKYAHFLQRPLKLGMFIPCDEDSNVLEEPVWQVQFEKNKVSDSNLIEKSKQHEQAKEKVLFEGFESVDTRNKDRFQVKLQKANISGSYDTIQNDFAGFYFHDSRNEKSRVKTIEDLLKFHPLELTQNAIKQLGL